MSHNNISVGELLVKLCELSREHNIDIRCRQSPFHPNGFEIQLDRKHHHAVGTVDITRIFNHDPEETAEYVFQRSLYNLKQLEEKNYNENY